MFPNLHLSRVERTKPNKSDNMRHPFIYTLPSNNFIYKMKTLSTVMMFQMNFEFRVPSNVFMPFFCVALRIG